MERRDEKTREILLRSLTRGLKRIATKSK